MTSNARDESVYVIVVNTVHRTAADLFTKFQVLYELFRVPLGSGRK